jgi:exoribonuclease-2
MSVSDRRKVDLREIARRAMLDRGLEPEFPPRAIEQAARITGPASERDAKIRDLRSLVWCSIDNDDSKDLDQLSVAERLADGCVKVLVAVADVDALVRLDTPIDQHAARNTTSVYTAAKIFPMLPEKLSTNLTSLNEAEDRLALVIEMIVDPGGEVQQSDVYRALVRNQAQLAYNSVAAWLENHGSMPEKVAKTPDLADQLRLQDDVAQRMRALRHQHGALELESIEPRAVLKDGEPVDLQREPKNRAKELIEDFMIAANGVSARFLIAHRMPSIRRVVNKPARWDRIVAVAQEYHDESLPNEPDAKALAEFLARRRKADPLRFPDLSLTIVKLLGPGEYVLEVPGQPTTGHFGLAVRDYTHSTAPNRRYPDVITHRLLKSALDGERLPYTNSELSSLASHCTKQEDAANKVERQVRKSAAALLLSHRIGETFDAIVTGASPKGTWARVLQPPVEGRVERGFEGLDVGQRIRVRLVSVNVERGFIDFERVS